MTRNFGFSARRGLEYELGIAGGLDVGIEIRIGIRIRIARGLETGIGMKIRIARGLEVEIEKAANAPFSIEIHMIVRQKLAAR